PKSIMSSPRFRAAAFSSPVMLNTYAGSRVSLLNSSIGLQQSLIPKTSRTSTQQPHKLHESPRCVVQTKPSRPAAPLHPSLSQSPQRSINRASSRYASGSKNSRRPSAVAQKFQDSAKYLPNPFNRPCA